MLSRLWIFIPALIFSANSIAIERWLIATQSELLNNNGILSLEVVKPSHISAWPDKLTLTIADQNTSELVNLVPAGVNHIADVRRSYTGIVNSKFSGAVRLELTIENSNRLLMAADKARAQPIEKVTDENVAVSPQQDSITESSQEKVSNRIVVPEPKEDRTITANEPLYFIVGSNSQRDFDARFQLSFKYRPFDPDARVAQFVPYASNLYFAYTQTSIWDLGGESSPFKDTSYRPSIYYNWEEKGNGYNPNSWKFGLEHESNGRDGDESRSINTAFVQPFWNVEFSGGKTFTFMPKFYYYIDKSENRDISHYRGYVDWLARYGRSDAAILTAMYRQGTKGYVQGQLDLSYPISDKIFGRTGTFLHLQLLGGYGETLIDYNKRSDTQLRIGISLAR